MDMLFTIVCLIDTVSISEMSVSKRMVQTLHRQVDSNTGRMPKRTAVIWPALKHAAF